LVKFHLIAFDPITPGFSRFIQSNSGLALSPLTSTLAISGKVRPKLTLQNSAISPASPGSWPPNWLQGKASTSKPLSR